MGDLVTDLIEIFHGTVLSETDMRHIVAEQWPGSPEVAHAMTYLRRHFPRGKIPKQVTELPGAPFNPITLRRAALALNCWRREDANIVAFPRTKRYDGRSG
jgi:hypothetical protein